MYVKNLVYTEVTGTPYASTATEVTVDDASVFGDPASVGNYDVTLYNLRKNPGKAFNDGEAAVLLLTGVDTGTNTLTFNTQIGITLSDSIEWAVIHGPTEDNWGDKADISGGNTFSGVQNIPDGVSFDGGTNTFSDYDSGAWTPELRIGGTAVTQLTQSGIYNRIGAIVYVEFRISTSSLDSQTGGVRIYGLPFTPSGSRASGAIGFTSGLDLTPGYSVVFRANNSGFIDLLVWDSSSGITGMIETEWTDDGEVRGSLIYQT